MKSNRPTKPPVALITGASAGIGEALARCFAREGHDLVLVARNGVRLREIADELHASQGARCVVMTTDLSVSGAASALATSLRAQGHAVDVLVNNAGVLEQGAFAAIDAQRHQQLIDLNVSGLTAMLAAFIPSMLARGSGRILNVASIAAFQPIPGLATYAATKAYVLSLSESLAEELRGRGISVTTLCPGITATGMLTEAAAHNARLSELPRFLVGEVDDVAAEGCRACLAGDVIVVPGAANLAATMVSRATPKWLLRRVAGVLGRRLI